MVMDTQNKAAWITPSWSKVMVGTFGGFVAGMCVAGTIWGFVPATIAEQHSPTPTQATLSQPITDPLDTVAQPVIAVPTEQPATPAPELVTEIPAPVIADGVNAPQIVTEPVLPVPVIDDVVDEVMDDGPAMDLVPGRLPACYYEDSEDCIWLAELEGNGIGTSFIRYDGVTYYPEGSGF